MKRLIVLLLFALAACTDGGLVDQIAREQAKDAVNPVLARNFPGVPLEPATDCVIENASAAEILKLARASVTGLTPSDTELVLDIALRPETLKCLLEDGLTPFLRL